MCCTVFLAFGVLFSDLKTLRQRCQNRPIFGGKLCLSLVLLCFSSRISQLKGAINNSVHWKNGRLQSSFSSGFESGWNERNVTSGADLEICNRLSHSSCQNRKTKLRKKISFGEALAFLPTWPVPLQLNPTLFFSGVFEALLCKVVVDRLGEKLIA